MASKIALGSSINCMPVKASVFAATIIPFIPILVPPAATACQLCAEVPGTQVAALKPTVGTAKLTSPTSVDPQLSLLGHKATPSTYFVFNFNPNVLEIFSAKAFSFSS